MEILDSVRSYQNDSGIWAMSVTSVFYSFETEIYTLSLPKQQRGENDFFKGVVKYHKASNYNHTEGLLFSLHQQIQTRE